MPPLPFTLPTEVQEGIDAARRRQRDLSEYQIPRLRDCQGPLSVQQNLAAELREDLGIFARQIEALSLSVGDQKGEQNRRGLSEIVNDLETILGSLRRDSRLALLASKKKIDSLSQSRKEELLSSSALLKKRDPNEKFTDDILMKTSNDVTDSLRRTLGLMQGELEKSVLTSQMLDSSSASLQSTSGMHDTLSNLMGTSKQLITALEKSDWLDRLLIFFALTFFFLIVLFILKQRLVDRGIRIAFWWTKFLPDFSSDQSLLMEAGEEIATAATATSVVTGSVVTSLVASRGKDGVSILSQVATPIMTVDEPTTVVDNYIHSIFLSSNPTMTLSNGEAGVTQEPELVHGEL